MRPLVVLCVLLQACGRFGPVEESCHRRDVPWTLVQSNTQSELTGVWGSGPSDIWGPRRDDRSRTLISASRI